MIKVMIADDDALVRMFLKQIIPWEEKGFCMPVDARDGEEALSLMRKFEPDIMIVDISMPVMNGIELVGRAKEMNYQGGIIMLSCHDDFDYVKTAMKLGADEYILKNHLTAEVLTDTLNTVLERVKENQVVKSEQNEISVFAQKGLREMRKEILRKLLEEDCTADKQIKLLKQAHIEGEFESCAAIAVRISYAHKAQNTSFQELCQQVAVRYETEVIPLHSNTAVFLLDMTNHISAREKQQKTEDLCSLIHNYAREYLQLSVSSGVSETFMGDNAVAKAVRQANKTLLLSFYGDGIFASTDMILLQEKPTDSMIRLQQEMKGIVQAANENLLSVLIEEVAQEFAKIKVMPGIVIDWLRKCDIEAGLNRPQTEYAQIDNIKDLKQKLEEYILLVQERKGEYMQGEISKSIEDAVRYIQRNFTESCSLSETAEAVGLTANYLSARFKQEMGIGFVEYVTELRIEQVKTLMQKERNESIKTIAEKAGFYDYQHFTKVFKKRIGYSPMEFRKKQGRQIGK